MPKVASYSSSDHKQTVDRANGHLFLSFALYRPYGARALQGIHNASPLLYHTYQDYTDCYKLRWMHTHTLFVIGSTFCTFILTNVCTYIIHFCYTYIFSPFQLSCVLFDGFWSNATFNLSLPLTHAYIIVHFIDQRSVETEGITDRLSVDDDVCIYMRLLHAMPTPLSWSGLVWSGQREREREREESYRSVQLQRCTGGSLSVLYHAWQYVSIYEYSELCWNVSVAYIVGGWD